MKKPSVVLDTNVLVSGIFWAGTPYKILRAMAERRFRLLATVPILGEYHRVIDDLGSRSGREALGLRWVSLITRQARIVVPGKSVKASRDPDDDKFVECAMWGRADALVTGDKDFDDVRNVPIMSPRMFVQRFL